MTLRSAQPSSGTPLQSDAVRVPAVLLPIRGEHEERIRTLFQETDFTTLDVPRDMRFVFLCFTNRCGSNLLAEILASTGRINKALESINAEDVTLGARDAGLATFAAYFSWLVRTRAVNGCFATKVALEQLVMLGREGALDPIASRSHFIVMQREDVLGQAISIAIAEQNEQWAHYLERRIPDEALIYSFERLEELMHWICEVNACFGKMFAFNGIAPQSIVYEHLLADPQRQIDRVAGRMGWPEATIDLDQVELQRQARAVNQAWRARFLADWRARA